MPLNTTPSKSAGVHDMEDENTNPQANSSSCPSILDAATATRPPNGPSDRIKVDRNVLVRRLIQELEQGLGYKGAACGDDFGGLLRGMRMQADETGIAYPRGSNAYRAFTFGVSFTHLCYPRHPLEVRIYNGIFTWLTVLIDDGAGSNHKQWLEFIPRFLVGERQPCSVSHAWAQYLRLAYKYYSTAVANFIVTSSLNFVNATALEGCELRRLTRTAGGENWPYYLREKDGVGEAYVWLTFPKTVYPDVSMCIEVVADMNKYLCFTNDIFSFHKEECTGEDNNYVHNRAFYSKKDVGTVLEEIVVEDINAFRRIIAALQGREPYAQAWLDIAMGFIAFHRQNKRYRLQELGIEVGDMFQTVL